MTDWDAELKKIDKQLESMSDKALIPAPAKGASPAVKAQVAVERGTTRTWPALVRLALATALAVGILFWPYEHQCGIGIVGYLAAISVVTVGGLWSSIWTWRHRTARAHILSLFLVAYGLVLAAVEVLPRTGYARADSTRPVGFSCSAVPQVLTPSTKPVTPPK